MTSETYRRFVTKKAVEEPEPVAAETEKKEKVPLKELLRNLSSEIRGYLLRINIEKDFLLRVLIVGLYLIFFSILQTTFNARFQIFGATPDLILSFVIAVAFSEGPKFGAWTGLVAGLVIDALGNVTPGLSPLLYMPIGYFTAVLTEIRFSKSFAVRLLFTLAAGLPRALMTLLQLMLYRPLPLGSALTDAVLPEFFATIAAAAVPHFLIWISLKGFHRPRAEKVK
ncbi:MAG: rod shape-determining protein MreD [Clostridia bacterium]|nr:rod shape-determining protein MreD [Clostridia bacterium]